MRLFITIALAVWFGIYLSRHGGELFSFLFTLVWWLATAPFHFVRWACAELFGTKARERRQAQWVADTPNRLARAEAKRKNLRVLGILYALLCLAVIVTATFELAVLPLMGKWAVCLPFVGIGVVVALIFWWNRRWKRLHGTTPTFPHSLESDAAKRRDVPWQ